MNTLVGLHLYIAPGKLLHTLNRMLDRPYHLLIHVPASNHPFHFTGRSNTVCLHQNDSRKICRKSSLTCLSVRRLLTSGSSSCVESSPAGSWNSSSSSAFSLATASTDGGKQASSATWIPKLWSQTPGKAVNLVKKVKTIWFKNLLRVYTSGK